MLSSPAAPHTPSKGARSAMPTYDYGEYIEEPESNHGPTLTFDPEESGPDRNASFRNASFTDVNTSPSQSRRRDHSVPALLSSRLYSRSPSPPKSHNRPPSLEMPLTGDDPRRRRQDSPAARLAGWFSGGGGPTTPSAEESNPLDLTPKKRGTGATDTTPKNTSARLGFLSSSVTAITTRIANQITAAQQYDDELLDMNVEATLLPPTSSPTDHDTFSPAAYKNLQTNAVGLLQRMQTAYRQRTRAFHEIQSERDVLKDEMEESETRVQHLKMQLEGMAAKAADQERSMKELMAELRHEKKMRAEERLGRERTMTEGSLASEDLGVDEDERKKWRKSGATVKSDMSFDTDEESAESESVFSRSRSPTIMTSYTDANGLDMSRSSYSKNSSLSSPRSKQNQNLSTFQKIVKGISKETVKEEDENEEAGCDNCKGQDASIAWETVSFLRDENKFMKHRVAQLEVAVEGALDLVNGIGQRVM